MDKERFVREVCSSIKHGRGRKLLEFELLDHIGSAAAEMREKEDITENEAEQRVMRQLGSADVIVSQYRAVCSKCRKITRIVGLFLILTCVTAGILLLSFPPFAFTGLTQISRIAVDGHAEAVLSSSETGTDIIILLIVLLAVFAAMIPVAAKTGQKYIANRFGEFKF